jgi:hypothetical protein
LNDVLNFYEQRGAEKIMKEQRFEGRAAQSRARAQRSLHGFAHRLFVLFSDFSQRLRRLKI